MARILDIEMPPIEYLDASSSDPVGLVEFSNSKLFHPAVIDNIGKEDPKNPTPQEIALANAFAKDFASRRGLVIAQDAHVGNIVPKFVDAKTGKEFKGDYSNIPKSQIATHVPANINSLEWDDRANLPYFKSEETGDIQYVPQDYFFLPRFNPNRGKSKEELMASDKQTLNEGYKSYPSFMGEGDPPIKIKDLRKIDAASGVSLTDKNRLNVKADTAIIKGIVTSAKKYGIDPYTALAISVQETGLGDGWKDNPFHLTRPQTDDVISESIKFLKDKLAYGSKLGKKTEAEIIQAWNGYGKITPNSELGGNMYYGIDVSKTPLDMNLNPVYGKRVIDIRENILKSNPELVKYIQSIK